MKFKAKHDYIQDLNTFWSQCIQAFYNTLALEREGNIYLYQCTRVIFSQKDDCKGALFQQFNKFL